MQQDNRIIKRRIIVVVAVVVAVLAVVLIAIFSGSKSYDYGPELKIQNYKQLIKDMPKERRSFINSELYNAVSLYTDASDLENVRDAKIREDSVTRMYDESIDTTHGTFIVDIESLRQSYSVFFFWSLDPNVNAFPNAPIITCLEDKDVIYEDFDCKVASEGEKMNQIYQKELEKDFFYEAFLPRSGDGYYVSRELDDDGDSYLAVSLVSETCASDKLSEKNKANMVQWMSDKGYDFQDYDIRYTYSCDGV